MMQTDEPAPPPFANPSIYYILRLPLLHGEDAVNLMHVRQLRRHGLRAFALVDRRANATGGEAPRDVPMVRNTAHLTLTGRDWVVVPGACPLPRLRALSGQACRIVAHVQDPVPGPRHKANLKAATGIDLAGGFCPTDAARGRLSRDGSGAGWHVVPPVVAEHFFEAAKDSRKRQIAVAAQRRPDRVEALRAAFRSRYPQHGGIPWTDITTLSPQDAARVLGEAMVFVALGRLDASLLPPLEAMAAGCLVCGVRDGAGSGDAHDDTGWWAAEGDLPGLAVALDAALTCPAPLRAERRAAGRRAARAFGEDRPGDGLLRAWRGLLTGSSDHYLAAPRAAE